MGLRQRAPPPARPRATQGGLVGAPPTLPAWWALPRVAPPGSGRSEEELRPCAPPSDRPLGATGGLVGAPPTTPLMNFRATHGGASPALQRLPGAAPGAMLPPSLNTWWGAPVIPPARRVARRSPPHAPLRRRTSAILHTTTPRVAEVRATRSAMPLLLIVVAAARGWSQLGLRRTTAPPPYRPRRNLGVPVGERPMHLERRIAQIDDKRTFHQGPPSAAH